MRRRPWIVAVVVVVLLAGCGGDRPKVDDDEGDFQYGSGTEAPSATTTTSAPPTSPPAAPAPTTSPAPQETSTEDAPASGASPPSTASQADTVKNRSTTTHPSGLELQLIVADKLEFERTEDISFQLSFVNRTGEDLFRNGAQSVYFAISDGTTEWNTTSCQPDFGGQRPPPTAIPIEPGEENRFVGTYPGAPGSRTREQCRLGPGTYEVVGMVAWCPPETISRSSGGGQACDSEADVDVRSAPLEISIR